MYSYVTLGSNVTVTKMKGISGLFSAAFRFETLQRFIYALILDPYYDEMEANEREGDRTVASARELRAKSKADGGDGEARALFLPDQQIVRSLRRGTVGEKLAAYKQLRFRFVKRKLIGRGGRSRDVETAEARREAEMTNAILRHCLCTIPWG